MKAYVKVGEILASLKNGIHPNAIKTKLKKLKPKFTNDDLESIWEVNILPWFGEYAIMEVTTKLLERYVEKRWGLSAKGEIQGKRDTFKKHMRSLKTAIIQYVQTGVFPRLSLKRFQKRGSNPFLSRMELKPHHSLKPRVQKMAVSICWHTGSCFIPRLIF